MIKAILEKTIQNKSIIGIRTISQEVGESIIGFIVKFDESSFTINEIDEFGFFIGYTIIEIENIINIDVNDRYLRRLMFIHNNSKNFNINERITVWKEGFKLLPLLKEIKKDKKITTFYFNEDEYVVGYILRIEYEQIEVNNIGREGDEDGISYHFINNLIGLRFDSLEEQKIKLLYENRAMF